MEMIITAVIWLIFGTITSYFAKKRGRDPTAWFFIGMFLGIIGLIIVLLLKPLEPEPQEKPPQPPLLKPVNDWYYLDATHQQQGPVAQHKLKNLLNEGTLSPNTLVWCEGMEEWKSFSQANLDLN